MFRPATALVAGLLCTLVPAGLALAATPESVSLTPSSPSTLFTTSLIGGVGLDGSTCTEDVSCDTVGVVLQPGDYTGKNLKVAIDWLVTANDFDLYGFRDGLGGPAVGASHGGAPGTHEEFVISLDGVLAASRRYVPARS